MTDTVPARQRTPFGLLDNSHHDVSTRYTTVRKQASLTDMAQLLREGTNIADVAEAHGISANTLRCRLHNGGWSINGEPNTAAHPAPAPAPNWRGMSWASSDLSWQKDAACRGLGVDLFFPPQGDDGSAGKLVCRPCPVKAACGEWATVHDERGIWGELNGRQRTRLRAEMSTKKVAV